MERPAPSPNGPESSFELQLVRGAPLAWGVCALALGLLLASVTAVPAWLAAVLGAAAGAGAWLLARARRETGAWVLAFLAAAALGTFRLAVTVRPPPPEHVANLTLPEGEATIEGVIADTPVPYPSRRTTTLRLAARRIEEDGGRGPRPLRGEIRVVLHWLDPALAYGDLIRVRGRLFAPSPPTNPGQSDYRAFLLRRGVHALISAWDREDVALVSRRAGSPFKHLLVDLRRWATGRLAAAVGSPESEVLGSIVFGFRSGLSPELLESFRVTGLMHILVASGMNVGLLAWLCLNILGALGVPRVRAAPLTLPILVAFLLLCGADPPLTRATIMFGVLVGAQTIGRAPAPLNALGAAAVLILLAEPRALWDRSFQFSYAATFGVMALVPRIVERRGKIPRLLIEAGACTFAAQIALLPLLAATFATVPLLGALANLFVTPVIGLFLAGGLAVLALGWIPFLGAALGAVLKSSLGLVLVVVDAFAQVPLASVVAPPFSGFALLFYAMWTGGSLLWFAAPDGRGAWTRYAALAGAAGTAFLLWRGAATHRPGDLSVTFLDVGQGLAAVIRLPSGRAILFDAGPPYAGGAVVAPYLRASRTGRLAAAIASHHHADHAGGMPLVLTQFPTDLFLISGEGFSSTLSFRTLREVMLSGRAPCRIVWDGVRLEGEPGVALRFLHPPRGWFRRTPRARRKDDNSPVLLIEYGETAALLTGDLRSRGEERLRGRFGRLPPHRLLQVPHHGGGDGSTPEFLAAFDPAHAVVSAGERNRFGHPHPAVLIRYRDQGTILWQTAHSGAVVARSDGRRWTVAPATRSAR